MSRILLVTPELAELAPVGGIAEYVLGLAGALMERGHDVRVALPAYDYLTRRPDVEQVKERLVAKLGFGASGVSPVYGLRLPCPTAGGELPVLLFGGHRHFRSVESERQVYDWPSHDPWIVFSRAVVDYLSSSAADWAPDVVHCQDSHTALVPVFLNGLRRPDAPSWADEARTVLTIHNLLNQGMGPLSLLAFAGLPADRYHDRFEFWGQANCFKAGILEADVVNTVSRTYAREICETSDYGFGLEGVLRVRRDAGELTGIVNGIDDHRWTMPGLRYDGHDSMEAVLEAKRQVRDRLYPEWGWLETGEPLVAFRGRWDYQKGVDLMVDGLPEMARSVRTVVVTWGTPGADVVLRNLWERLQGLAAESPERILVNPAGVSSLNGTADHYAVADYFLMPSRYEPCGLTQQECQRFGTVPIVRATGGLVDTVAEEATDAFPSPNGYVFGEMKDFAMAAAVDRAVRDFGKKSKRARLVKETLAQRNDWRYRVPEYESLYGCPQPSRQPAADAG